MRPIRAALVGLFLASSVQAQEIRYTFRSIPWGSSAAATQAALKAAGYTVSPPDKNGDIEFTGQILGHSFDATAIMSPTAGLAKISLIFETDHEYKDVYQTIVRALTEKYGPGQDIRAFDSPYTDGDGHEETAILMGKGHLYTLWAGVNDDTGLTVTADTEDIEIIINVAYESTLWTVEAKRREAHAF